MNEAAMMTLQSLKITWQYFRIPSPISHYNTKRRIDLGASRGLIVTDDYKYHKNSGLKMASSVNL